MHDAMPSADDPNVDPGEEMTPQARAPAPKPAPEPADQPAPGPAPVQPTGMAQPGDVAKSFAAQGFGAPSADYKGPALPPQGTPAAASAPEAQPDQTQGERYHDAYAQADEDWKKEYDAQHPFATSFDRPPTPTDRYAAAERESDRAELGRRQQAIADQRDQQRQANDAREAQLRGNGQQFYKDAEGNLQPVIDSESGRPLYHETAWEEGQNPKTGEVALTKRDKFGQRQFKAPQLVANPDHTDDQLYYQMPDGSTKPAGKIEDLVKSPDFRTARMATRAMAQRRQAEWKEAIAPMEGAAADAGAAFDEATMTHDTLAQQSADLGTQIDQLSTDPRLGQKQGGILGFGAHLSPEATQLQSQLDAAQKQKDVIDGQLEQVRASIKPGGDLFTANRKAKLNLQVFKAKAQHDSYQDMAEERLMILKQQGQDPDKDATLQSIRAAQAQYKDAISHFSGLAQQQATIDQQRQQAAPAAAPPPGPAGTPPETPTPACHPSRARLGPVRTSRTSFARPGLCRVARRARPAGRRSTST